MSEDINTFANTTNMPLRSGRWFSRLLMRHEALRGYTLLSPTLLIMTIGICIPLLILVTMSMWSQHGFEFDKSLTFTNYFNVSEQPIYQALLVRSILISGACTLATVLLAYPMAYFVAFHVHRHKMIWIILMTLPFWTSYLLRVFSWKIILGYNGVINSGLKGIGLIDQPLEFLLYSPLAVVITLTHAWSAFAVLPIYVSLEKIDRSLLEAATDLGDGPVMRFIRITFPLSIPGVIAAALIIFIPTVGDYITPTLLGGPDGIMLANLIQAQFGKVNDWPMGAALAITLMITVAIFSVIFALVTRKVTEQIK